MKNSATRILSGLILASLAAAGLHAQSASQASISGVVTDPQAAPIPGAQVMVLQTSTRFQRTVTTGSGGDYSLLNLPVGPYRLEVSADGFRTFAREGITLQVNSSPLVNVTLELGTVSEVVEVRADAVMTESQTTAISTLIDQQRMVELPLNGREPTQLILLSGSASRPPNNGIVTSKNYNSSNVVSVAGGQSNSTLYMLDGSEHMDKFGYINLPLPFPDALQEFSVETNAIPAQYGLRSGAVVNSITKSGTNELHGNLFEFMRVGATNARNFFAPARDNLTRNQFGGTLGGPIVKNRLFFFGGFQGTKIRTAPSANTAFVPTAAVLQGDFNALVSSPCRATPASLLDPDTGSPFPNNAIPSSRFNQQALNLLKYIPASTDPCGRLLFSVPNIIDENQIIGRSDWTSSEKHSLFGRYFFSDLNNPATFDGKNLLTTIQPGVLPRVQSVSVGDTYLFSPTLIHTFQFTYSRERITRGPAPNPIGFPDLGVNVAPSEGNFARVTLTGRFSTSCGTCSLALIDNTAFQYKDDVNVIRGSHQIGFGGDFIRSTMFFSISTSAVGQFGFNGEKTNDALADFLLGRPNTFSQGQAEINHQIQRVFGAYVQDKWRASNSVTLSYGLRWDPYFPSWDRNGKAWHFDRAAFDAGRKSQQYDNAPAGLFFPGDAGMTRSGTTSHWTNFAPRLGLAWDPAGDGKTTIRASYGILYDLPSMQFFDRFSIGAPFNNTVSIFSPAGGFTNPYLGYPGGNPFPLPQPAPRDAAFPDFGPFITLPTEIKPTYDQAWNFTVQRQVGSDWLLSINYLGRKATHRWLNRAINPAVYIPGNSTTANTNNRRTLFLANAVDGRKYGVVGTADDGGNANYHGLRLSAKHRFAQSFSLLVNYTWAHCISDGDFISELFGFTSGYQDVGNRAADRANCEADQRHNFNSSLVATTPHFEGALAQKLLGNWTLSSIITYSGGLPLNIRTGVDNSRTGLNLDRPNVVGDPRLESPTIERYFNTSAFQPNAIGEFGNAGRNVFMGPGGFNFDVALSRDFDIPGLEGHRLTVRGEAFNVLNHPTFNGAGGTASAGALRVLMSDPNFGRILTANDPRILQFALKYTF